MAQRRPSKTINTLGPGWPRSEDRAMCSGGITTRAPTGLSHRKTVQAARPVVHPTGRDQPGSIPQLAGAAASAQCRIRTKLDAHASAHGWKSAICGPLRRQIRPCAPATNLHIIPANSSSAHTNDPGGPLRQFPVLLTGHTACREESRRQPASAGNRSQVTCPVCGQHLLEETGHMSFTLTSRRACGQAVLTQ